jgi:2-keto-4-pentenoate hydratase
LSNGETVAQTNSTTPELARIADAFVSARLQGASLADFPGRIPDDLAIAYQVQDLAIARWPDRVVGWKVGFIAAERRDGSGDDRLLGPIFARGLLDASMDDLEFPVFSGGFGAVEAEYVLRLQADAPPDKLDWSADDVSLVPATLHLGVEVASSPLATINLLGPRVVVSDFGNNNGLVLGARIREWPGIADGQLTCQTFIDDALVGSGGALSLPGGLRAAFAFALSRSAKRGRPLKAGDLIATGNATGIHDIVAGQTARISFSGLGDIVCRARTATPIATHGTEP